MANAQNIDWSQVNYNDLINSFQSGIGAPGSPGSVPMQGQYQGFNLHPSQYISDPEATLDQIKGYAQNGMRIDTNGNPQSNVASTNGVDNGYSMWLGRGANGMTTSRYDANSGGMSPTAYAALMASAIGAGYGFGGLGGEAGAAGGSGLGSAGAAGEGAGGFVGDSYLANGMGSSLATDAAAGGASSGAAGAAGAAGALPGAAGGGGAAGAGAGGGSGIMSQVGSALGSPLGKLGVTAAGGLLGGLSGKGMPSSQTSTTQNMVDPRMGGLLYGADGHSGLLNQIAGQANRPQSAGMAGFGNGMDDYLSRYGRGQFDTNMRASQQLTGSNINAPQMTAAMANSPSDMQAAQINAPSQNGLNLSGAYNQMVYGDSAQNPYLTGAIQKGINQSNNAFGNMQEDSTRNLMQNIMPGIRSGAVASGQYGGSRQGIAEGSAIGDFARQQQRAISQFGQNNTDAAVGAQAGAYDAGQNRSLSAMSGLGAQQYGVATNDAQMRQQANQTNYQGQLQTSLANQAASNAAAQNNGQWQQGTNALNSNNQQAGIGLSSGLLNNAYTYGSNQDQYGMNQLGKTSGLLSPFSGLGGGQTNSQPLYQNTAGNVLGGATAGLGLLNMFNKNNTLTGTNNPGAGANGFVNWS